MKSTFKVLGATVLALSFALCGHGADWTSFFPGLVAFRPMVGKDAQFALAVNLDRDQASRIIDTNCDLALDALKAFGRADDKKIVELKERIAAFKKNPFMEAPEDKFLEWSGLRDAELRWAVLPLEGFEIVDDMPQLGGFSLALAGKIDPSRLISALRRDNNDDAVFEETRVEGETAWHIVPDDPKKSREMQKLFTEIYVASLDGRLVLFTASREALARQIRLYRTGRGRGGALGGFSAAEGEWLHLHLSDVGGLVRKYVPVGVLEKVNQFVPDGDKLLCGLGDLDVDERALPNGMLSSTLSLRTASGKDADTLRTLAEAGLLVLNAKIAQEPAAPDSVKKLVRGIRVGGSDAQFEVRSPIPIGTIAVFMSLPFSRGPEEQSAIGSGDAKPGKPPKNARVKLKPKVLPPSNSDKDAQLTEAQQALLSELQEALDDENFRRVAKIVKKIQDDYHTGGDAAVPPYMRELAVEALSWFLPDSLAELIGFMADSNPDVLEGVMKNFTEAIDDPEFGDRELATIFKKVAPLIEDDDAIDAILMGLENDMRNSVAVDTYKELFKTGSEAIKKRLVESMQDFTGEDFTTPEQLDAWLKENPDDKDDEKFYGKPDKDDKDDGKDGKSDHDGKSEKRQ